MKKKEYCMNNPVIAYYSGFGGLEIHGFEYGIDTYIYCTSGAWTSKKSYHKVKLHSTLTGNNYFIIHGYRVSTADCLRVDL